MSSDVDVNIGVDGYTGGVSVGEDGSWSFGGAYTGSAEEAAPPAPVPAEEGPVAELLDAAKTYALPLGVALALLLVAAGLRGSR